MCILKVIYKCLALRKRMRQYIKVCRKKLRPTFFTHISSPRDDQSSVYGRIIGFYVLVSVKQLRFVS